MGRPDSGRSVRGAPARSPSGAARANSLGEQAAARRGFEGATAGPSRGDGRVGWVLDLSQVRDLALGLPEATEEDHHGIPSFRVGGRIFATVPDADHVRIMAPEEEIRAAAAEDPAAYAEFWWGSRLACVVVALDQADPDQVTELLADAWRRKAPRRLVRELDADA